MSTQNVAASTQKWAARREIQDAMVSLVGDKSIGGIVGWLADVVAQICQLP
ncbi:hypothetical protein [Donghicola sp. XS_ASV15]|uniref:hypothetical protein n=1 Tax=Donghicola sp. XS_ASV15 TaxID=3241295 RepID=UPI003512D1FA